jgi:uncharacterized membrane protein YGL010W
MTHAAAPSWHHDAEPKETNMKTLSEQLAQYAAYHRDARNITTHFVGIPMIVLAVVVLLSRPVWAVGGLPLSPAVPAVAAATLYYLALDWRWGTLMGALLALALWFGTWAAAQGTAMWLALGAGGFLAGWVIQFIGHYFEGRKPAFIDDLSGLLIGPLFVVAEALFLLGQFGALQKEVERRAGPVRREYPDAGRRT